MIERDDGVRYRLHEGIAGPGLPHDLVHLIVERETGDDGGFWGAVADGAVFGSMEHLSGRRPPHARARARTAIRRRAQRLMRAELMAGLVTHVARHRLTSADDIRAAAREALSTLPDPTVDERRVLRAGRALSEAEKCWAGLAVGDELVETWPSTSPARRSRRR